MINNTTKFILQEETDKSYTKHKQKNLNIKFNRIAFIFFIFFLISAIYFIHLSYLGSRSLQTITSKNYTSFEKIQRADIIDRNGTFLAKTVNSIDIGINPLDVISKEKLLINLKYIFPYKNYDLISLKLEKKKFFWFEKKISD